MMEIVIVAGIVMAVLAFFYGASKGEGWERKRGKKTQSESPVDSRNLLSVHAQDNDSAAIPGALVAIWSCDENGLPVVTLAHDWTDSDGDVVFMLDPGEYQVRISGVRNADA